MNEDVVADTWCPQCGRVVEAEFQSEAGGYAVAHVVGRRSRERHSWHLRGIGVSS